LISDVLLRDGIGCNETPTLQYAKQKIVISRNTLRGLLIFNTIALFALKCRISNALRGNSNVLYGSSNALRGNSNVLCGNRNALRGNSNVLYGSSNALSGNRNAHRGSSNGAR
jgi:hypothetical protein